MLNTARHLTVCSMIHLLRPCVGVHSIEQLAQIQAHERRIDTGPMAGHAYFTTRNMPKRANELVNGGSIYWIIKNVIQVRQAIEDVQQQEDEGGRKFCLALLNPQLVRLQPRQQRGFQGWRYLQPEKAPDDIGPYVMGEADHQPPADMAEALRAAGLL